MDIIENETLIRNGGGFCLFNINLSVKNEYGYLLVIALGLCCIN